MGNRVRMADVAGRAAVSPAAVGAGRSPCWRRLASRERAAPRPVVDDAGAPPPTTLGDDSGMLDELNLGPPFAVTGLQPSHGPWTGGRAPPSPGAASPRTSRSGSVRRSSPPATSSPAIPRKSPSSRRPARPGRADVRVSRTSTSAQQATAPGGLHLRRLRRHAGHRAPRPAARASRCRAAARHWTAASTVRVGGKPCTAVTFTDATDLACTTPANGRRLARASRCTNADGTGRRGGRRLRLQRLARRLPRWPLRRRALRHAHRPRLRRVDRRAAPGSAGHRGLEPGDRAPGDARRQRGRRSSRHPRSPGTVTVTVGGALPSAHDLRRRPGRHRHRRTCTPTLDPACAQGDPPSTGNYIPQDDGDDRRRARVAGGIEFQRAAWAQRPTAAGANERQAAYVFTASGSPVGRVLPSPTLDGDHARSPTGSSATQYTLGACPGNTTLYALAGLEEDSDAGPSALRAFRHGHRARGAGAAERQDRRRRHPDDDAARSRRSTTVPQPPPPTPRGPDRLVSTLAIDLGAGSYACLPQGTLTSAASRLGQRLVRRRPRPRRHAGRARYDLRRRR